MSVDVKYFTRTEAVNYVALLGFIYAVCVVYPLTVVVHSVNHLHE